MLFSWYIGLFQLYFVCVSVVNGLFEDQIGKFDWRQQYVGKVRHFAGDRKNAKNVFVSTEENVVAAIDIKSGEIVWRQVLEDTGAADSGIDEILIVDKDLDVLTITGKGQFLRAWDKHVGTAKWDSPISEDICENARFAPSLADRDLNTVVVLACSYIVAYDSRNGEQLWSHHMSSSEGNSGEQWLGLVATDAGELVAVGGVDEKLVSVETVNAFNGVKKDRKQLAAPWFDQNKCWIAGTELLCLESNGRSVHSVPLLDTLISANFQLDSTAANLVVLDAKAGYFASKNGRSFTVYKTGGKNAQKLLTVDDVLALQLTSDTEQGDLLTVVRVIGNEQVAECYQLPSGKLEQHLSVTFALKKGEYGPVTKVFSSFAMKDGGLTVQYIVLTADNALIRPNLNGKLGWSREESLTSVLSVEMLDLPLSESQANIEKEFSTEGEGVLNMLFTRLKSQAIQVQRALLKAAEEILDISGLLEADWLKSSGILDRAGLHIQDRLSSRVLAAQVGSEAFERDYFNLHKVIVIATATGKIMGLDNRKGGILWQHWVENLQSFGGEFERSLPIYVQRTTAHFPHPARCVVVGKHKLSGNGMLVALDPMTGRVVEEKDIGIPIGQILALPFANHMEIHGLLISHKDKLEALVYPSDVYLPSDASIFTMRSDARSGIVEGFRFVTSRGKTSGTLENVWRTPLSLGAGQTLVKVAGKRISEKLHSQGRVSGDRSVLYKYANPNLVAVTALGVGDESTLSVFLLDAVNGQVLFSAQHQKSSGPLHLVHCENWVLYSYWNQKARRTEVSVLEFYEGKSQSDSEQFSSLSPTQQPPMVFRQGYIFPQGITAMTVTDTEMGLTNRHVLLAMPFGGLLEMPKAVLDPRRVLIPTKESMEEGLMPYIPELPIATEHIINYNQTSLRIRGIRACPSGLESTSLVLAYGLDLFYTRVNPSGTFDILKDDFDHWFISAVLAALILGSVVSKKLAKHRDLKQSWK